jgi:hypothetical protein
MLAVFSGLLCVLAGLARFYPTVGEAVDAYVDAAGVEWTDWEDRSAPHAPRIRVITVKRLWLLRRAKSSWDHPGLPDTDRPSRRGKRAAEG